MLALVTDAYGGRGGIAQYNRDFFGALARAGFSSITVLPRQAPDFPRPPETIEQLPARPGRVAYSVAALRAAFFRTIDIVFCGHLFMAPLAALIARLQGAKLIIQAHGIEAWPRPSGIQRTAMERADLLLCVSRHTRAAVLSWAAIAPERALVVPNTVREVFTPADGSAQRAALGLKSTSILLTVGRLDPRERYKGHDRVIAAIPDLVAKGHDICYMVVGEGDDRARLEALARDTGVSDRVRFLGAVGLQRLIEIYRVADLFVMPSTGEGFGVTFLEAMASGTPALGLDIAGAKDALADGELGTVASENELSAMISRILNQSKTDSVELAIAVHARFGQKHFANNALNVLNRLNGDSLTSCSMLSKTPENRSKIHDTKGNHSK
jgi:phosphatidylinositol alpha-1,6-mannosyltransferase